MAAYWKGFTRKEIELYLAYSEGEKESRGMRGGNRPLGRRQKSRRETAKAAEKEEELTIPEEAKLCSDIREVEPPMSEGSIVCADDREVEPLTAEEAMVCVDVPEDTPPAVEVLEDQKPVISGLSVPVCLKVIGGNGYELVEKDPKTVSPEMLEVFQARQKMLEEQNRRRKEMLTKVLEDRKKQTSEEAKRLKSIQDELHKLDLILSNDVGILRNQIESASIEFGEAQKRYNKAEKEYLEAKSTLFSKLEKKEMLTKHLCTIIEQNEMRKAQKLSELMEKLRINENRAQSDTNAVIISPYYESALKVESGNVNSGYETQEPAKVNT